MMLIQQRIKPGDLHRRNTTYHQPRPPLETLPHPPRPTTPPTPRATPATKPSSQPRTADYRAALLQVDYERDPKIHEGFIWAAAVRLSLRRLTAR